MQQLSRKSESRYTRSNLPLSESLRLSCYIAHCLSGDSPENPIPVKVNSCRRWSVVLVCFHLRVS